MTAKPARLRLTRHGRALLRIAAFFAPDGADEQVKICQRNNLLNYDSDGDYLEVIFEWKAGYFREIEKDAVMEKVVE